MTSIDYSDIIPDMKYFVCRYCTPKWTVNRSEIDFVDITYIIEGKATYIVNGVPYEAGKGDLLCIPKRSTRQAFTDPDHPMAAYASNFLLFGLNGKEIDLPFSIQSKIGLREDLVALFNELNLEWTQKKPGYRMKVRAQFLNILHKLFNILYYGDDLECMNLQIRKALKYIHEFYHTPITVKNLAEMSGLNPSYFGTLFKSITGFNVREYINMIRINNAEKLLLSGCYSISEVVHRCGFEDIFYFSRVFKKLKGYPPSRVKMVRQTGNLHVPQQE